MSEEKIFELQCSNCGDITKIVRKGEFIQCFSGVKYFISHEYPKNGICEHCGSEIYG